MEKAEMKWRFRVDLEEKMELLRAHLDRGEDLAAKYVAGEINGAVQLAARLGIIDHEQALRVSYEAWNLARRRGMEKPPAGTREQGAEAETFAVLELRRRDHKEIVKAAVTEETAEKLMALLGFD